MKIKQPYKIWVYHRKDGTTTFGEYINVKRRVFLSGSLNAETAAQLSSNMRRWLEINKPRQLEFAGDSLPKSFLDMLDYKI